MNYRVGLAIALVAAGACHDKGKPAVATDAAAAVAVGKPVEAKAPATTGQARLVNLYVDGAGQHVAVDVRAADAILVENLAYGAASDWFTPPEHAPITVTAAGGGAALGDLPTPTPAQHVTGTVTWMRQTDAGAVGVFWDGGEPSAPAAPPAGKGVLVIRADALWEHEHDLTPTTGSVAFFVGEGAGKCLHQRVEDEGFAASTVGGSKPVIVDLAPGKHTIALHRWPGKPCTTPVALSFDVDVAAGQGVLALVHSPDSKRLEVLQLPLGL